MPPVTNSMNRKNSKAKAYEMVVERMMLTFGRRTNSKNIGTSKPRLSFCPARLWPSAARNCVMAGIVPSPPHTRLTMKTHHNTPCRRHKRPKPAATTPFCSSAIRASSGQPAQHLSQELCQEHPVGGDLVDRSMLVAAGVTVIQVVAIEGHAIIGIDLHRLDLRLLAVHIAHPALLAVPVLTRR